MSVRRYTTPVTEFIIEGVNLSLAEVYVTFEQGRVEHTFTGDDVSVNYDAENNRTVINVHFSQELSSLFKAEKEGEVQINWMLDGERNATEIKTILFTRNLLEKILREG